MRASSLILAGASVAAATNLYVTSYSGTITTLELKSAYNGSFTLEKTSANGGCAPSPSWLSLDRQNKILYCLDENLDGGEGSISSYSTSKSGRLTQVDRHSTITGPVSSIVYNGGKAQAVAHYEGSSVTTWSILEDGGLEHLQTFTFHLRSPGTNPTRQDAPHPHEALVDPTDSYILINDLGADLVRVFGINHTTSELTPLTPLVVPAGSGPRHGAFLVQGNQTFFYLISELANTVVGYEVVYGPGSMEFTKIFSSGTLGPNMTVPSRVTSAEIIVSPDNKFLLTSTRNDTSYIIPDVESSNSSVLVSDSLETWSINPNGTLTLKQQAPAGGSFPRQFSVNKEGTLAAVGMQYSSRVVIVQRKPDGLFGEFVAEVEVDGQVTSVVWDD